MDNQAALNAMGPKAYEIHVDNGDPCGRLTLRRDATLNAEPEVWILNQNECNSLDNVVTRLNPEAGEVFVKE